MKTISIVNLKGGVGKTVTAVNLAAIFVSEYHKRVLLVDVDHQGNASRYCGVNTEERGGLTALLTGAAVCYDDVVEYSTMEDVDVIPADMSLATLGVDGGYTAEMAVGAMRDLRDAVVEDNAYDYIIFDCPPAFSQASIGAIAASSDIIIPLKIGRFEIEGMDELIGQIDSVRKINPATRIAGALLTMWHNSRVVRDGEEYIREIAPINVFQTMIRRTDKVDEAVFARQAIMAWSPTSAAAKDYRAWVAELLELWGVPNDGEEI